MISSVCWSSQLGREGGPAGFGGLEKEKEVRETVLGSFLEEVAFKIVYEQDCAHYRNH